VLNDVINDVSYVGSSTRGEILGLERRCFWRDADKLEIVMSVGVGGASVTQVAQSHKVTRQQIYAWRHKPWKPTSAGAIARNEAVNAPRYLGKALWRRLAGYHRRSRVESEMNCIKLLGQAK